MRNFLGALTLSIVFGGFGVTFSPVVLAQTSTAPSAHIPLQKTIGQANPEIVPSLIVMNSRSAVLQDGKLTMTGVAPSSIVFADRPVRAAGHVRLADLLEEWAPGNESSESFTKDPPNATVSAFSNNSAEIRDAVVVLKSAKLEGDRLIFDVDVLEGDLAGADGPASVFIDRFGFGGFHAGGFHGDFGRVGYAGVGRVERGIVPMLGAEPGIEERQSGLRSVWEQPAPMACVL